VDKRLRFIGELGKQILFVDLSNCSAGEVEEIARTVPVSSMLISSSKKVLRLG
jgi:hypothetical protein